MTFPCGNAKSSITRVDGEPARIYCVKSPSAAACSGACGDISTSCCLELKAAVKRAAASLLGALVMVLMKKMLSAAVVGFLHAGVEFRNLGQPVTRISRVRKNNNNQRIKLHLLLLQPLVFGILGSL